MKKILIFLIIFTSFIFKAGAETWSCSYMYKGEKGTTEVKRRGNIFVDIHPDSKSGVTGMFSIHKETGDYIVLIETYPYDFIPGAPVVFLLYLDKRKKGMAYVALGYPKSSVLIQSNCSIF